MQHRRKSGVTRSLPALLVLATMAGCAPPSETPTPRPIVIFTGARLNASPERMEVVDQWVRAEMTNITEDPTFLISTIFQPEMVYPWDGLELAGDTARVSIQGTAVDARTPFMIYGHLHLMARQGRLDEWLPEAVGLEGYELERAFMARVSDVWLYGRTVFDAAPHQPLEELIYSTENGYLDAFLLTARAEEFPEEAEQWMANRPNEREAYLTWFDQTFQDDPPGVRPEPNLVAPPAADTSRTEPDTGAAPQR